MSKLSWRMKLIALFALVLSASLLFQLSYIVPYVRNREVEMTKVHQEEIARSIAREVDVDLLRIKDRLERLARRPEIRNMDSASQQRVMFQEVEVRALVTSLFVMDAAGFFCTGTAEDFGYFTESYADQPYFAVPFEQGESYYSPPTFTSQTGLVSTSIGMPIESDTGERVGVLLGVMTQNPMIEHVANYPLEEGTIAYVVDREGTVVAHSRIDLFALDEGPLSLNYDDEPQVQAIISGQKSGFGEHDHVGTPYFGSYATIESNGWGAVVEAPVSVILAKTRALSRRLLLANIGSLAWRLP